MSAQTLTVRGRARAERDMIDTCVIRRRAGTSTDGETGVVTPTWTDVYTGKCKVQRPQPSASPSDVGQASLLIGDLRVDVPISAPALLADDAVTMTASVLDPALVGRVFRVRAVLTKTYDTARRLSCIEVTS